MKHKILTKMISMILTIAMLIGAVQLTVITAFADETGENSSEVGTVPESKKLTPAEAILKEMAERKAVTKDRSENTVGPYAVYIDGKFHANGKFYEMWNLAMDKAAYVVEDASHKNTGRYDTVEFVLYEDMYYKADWFGEKTMTISNRKLTIDLNGHLLQRVDQSGSVIKVTNNSILTIMDSNPTRENAGNIVAHGMWSPIAGGSKKIKGGVISGGYHSTGDGGGLYIDGKSKVYMTGGTIAGNKADVGSAVYLEDNSVIDMSVGNSQICYNYCAGTSTDGGTIFLRSDCTVIGGYVHDNLADDYGGGVRAKGGEILVKDVVIYNNRAEDYGGGLYIERSFTSQTVAVTGCKIVGNNTGKDGGGVYIYDLYSVNMNDCIVENNLAGDEGGGICVSDYNASGLSISGKMIVRNNYVSNKSGKIKSNLYLEGDDDLSVGALSLGSEIWIRTEEPAEKYNGINKSISPKSTATSHLYFFADEDGYTVKYQDDPTKEKYRFLYIAKGTRTEYDVKLLDEYITMQQPTPYIVETGDHKGETKPILKGYFEYDLMSTDDYDSVSPFYYSDGYFLEDPTVYNTHLATMSINAAVAAFGRMTTHIEGNGYANHFANIKQLFSDIECYDSNFFANEDYQMKPDYFGEDGRLTTIGVAISQKEIKAGDETFTLVPVAIRGGGYETEWASNVTIGGEGEAKGFSDAAGQVYAHIDNYIKNYGLTEKVASGKVKFWVVGYSRAGATANLTSKRLVDFYGEKGNQVYGYTFEAPMGGLISERLIAEHTGNGAYPTIHNTVNDLDFVTLVAPKEMGFIRYGVDHKIGSTTGEAGISYDVNGDYYNQRAKMLEQLRAINPYYNFDDLWLPTLLSLTEGVIGDGVISTNYEFDQFNSMYSFLRCLFRDVQYDGLDFSNNNSSYRYLYSEKKPLGSIQNNRNNDGILYSDPKYNFGYSDLSVQDAAANLVWLVMGSLTDDQFSGLLEAVLGKVPALKDEYLDFELWVLAVGGIGPFLITLIKDIMDIYDIISKYVFDWQSTDAKTRAENIDWLIHQLLDVAPGQLSVWDVLSKEQAEAFAESLPVLLWFALNYVTADINVRTLNVSMRELPTFMVNASSIISNHYQEVSVAWVRSYDTYYKNETQAYRLDASKVVYDEPVGLYVSGSKTLTLSGQNGSSLFYSIDGGETWNLYSKAVAFEQEPESIQCFSIYRGVKSEVKEISTNPWAGSILSNGSIWLLIIGAAFIVGFCVVGIEISRKKKKEETNVIENNN